jgi:hypothetical protein
MREMTKMSVFRPFTNPLILCYLHTKLEDFLKYKWIQAISSSFYFLIDNFNRGVLHYIKSILFHIMKPLISSELLLHSTKNIFKGKFS